MTVAMVYAQYMTSEFISQIPAEWRHSNILGNIYGNTVAIFMAQNGITSIP